ncbi:MAG: aryl-sulfate sulfotransferase [Myxococcota bacterium]
MWRLWLACGPDPKDVVEDSPSTVDTDSPPAHTGDTGVAAHTGDTGTTGSTTDTGPAAISVSCDPTDNALRFTCHVTVDPPQGVQIAFRKADGTGPERVHQSLDPATDHDVPLYFLAPATEYVFDASGLDGGPVATGSVTSGVPVFDLASSMVVEGTSSTPLLGTNIPCGTGATYGIYDSVTGELVWYQVADPYGHFGGYEMMQFTEDHTMLGQSGAMVTEFALDGTELLRKVQGLDYFDDLHHDLFKRDGQIWLLYRQFGPVILDGFVVWDAAGTEVARWFMADHLDIPLDAEDDWSHTNTIWVEDGFVYLSSYTQHTVMKIDGDLAAPTFGDPAWFLAGSDGLGFGQDFAVDWSAVDGDDGFVHQHALRLTADGRLMFLDNANGRALVLSVDESTHTATVDEAYAANQPSCSAQGTASQTGAGNYLVNCASMEIREYEPGADTPVFTGTLVCENGGGGGSATSSAARWYALDGW